MLGAIFLTDYLDGAVATHVRVGAGLFPICFLVVFGVLIWRGPFLRDERLRKTPSDGSMASLPMTTTPNLAPQRTAGGPSWLQSARLVAAVAELGSLGAMQAKALVLLDEVQCQELDAFLAEHIYEFNSKATGYFDGRLLGHAFKMKLASHRRFQWPHLGRLRRDFASLGHRD